MTTFNLPRPATQAIAKAAIRELGMTFRKTEWNEYRVGFGTADEGTAYYTADLEDAIGTARLMRAERDAREVAAYLAHAAAAHRACIALGAA